jgi:hypothetical protein
VSPKNNAQKEEKEIADTVKLLKMERNATNLFEKVVIEMRLMTVSEDVRSRARIRLRQEAARLRREEAAALEEEEEYTIPKIGRDKDKTATEMKADRAKLATADTAEVAKFMGELQDQLHDCSNLSDPQAALRKAAKVDVDIPTSCKPPVKAALRGVLTSIASTVERVFDESDTLVIPRSSEEVEAEQRMKDRTRKLDHYSNKVESHKAEYKKAKTVFGKDYEKGRTQHYGKKVAALPQEEDLQDALKAAGGRRKQQVDDQVMRVLADLTNKVQTALATAGGTGAYPQGTDGGVAAMTKIVKSYAEKLTLETEAAT